MRRPAPTSAAHRRSLAAADARALLPASTASNIIFLDAPIGVGGSYSDSSKVDNTPQMAEDVFAFLTLFLAKYDKYAAAPFHISGESYGASPVPWHPSRPESSERHD